MPAVLRLPHELQFIIATDCKDAPTRAHLALMHRSWTSAAEDALYVSIRIENEDAFGSPNFLSFCYAVTHNERKAQRVRALRITGIGFQALAEQFCALLELLPHLQYLHVPNLGPTALQRLTNFLQSEAALPHLWMMSVQSDMIPDTRSPINPRSKPDVQRARFRDAILARSTFACPLRVISLQYHTTFNEWDALSRRIRTLAPSLSVMSSPGLDNAFWPCLYAEDPRLREAYLQDCLDAMRLAHLPLFHLIELTVFGIDLDITSSEFSTVGAIFASIALIGHIRRVRIVFESTTGSDNLQAVPDTPSILATIRPAGTMGVLWGISIEFGRGVRYGPLDKATVVQIAQVLVEEGCSVLERLQIGRWDVRRKGPRGVEGGKFGSWR
ncbi:hypothetical protein EXIGLDRAFT_831236 [Exidia glandulosa HHB12029]|uniref:Uncharacterized protein n=1 Tax=Exidia glandulosa HHB12029 TaxID=1314781 RepID=A0A165MS18_EXIGL|nr:hypothetical protein EXIGLDRAFT_831236 [Exidia glandulosa HHB12029]